jgi:hypothetical protein
MGISFSIDPERGRLHLEIEGEFTTEEMVAVTRAFIESPDLPDGFTALSDHTQVARPLTSSQLLALVTVMEEHPKRFAEVRWAMVSTRPSSYGMMRVLAARAQLVLKMRVRIFFDVERATQWLDMPGGAGPQEEPPRG